MVISINDTRTIGEVQEDFQKAFPNLKLEFFSQPHQIGQGSPKKLHIGGQTIIGQLRQLHNNGYLNVAPDISVGEVEERLRDFYGLNAQVFRRQGNDWVETTVTDDWTLAQHNQFSADFAQKEISPRPAEELDIHEQE